MNIGHLFTTVINSVDELITVEDVSLSPWDGGTALGCMISIRITRHKCLAILIPTPILQLDHDSLVGWNGSGIMKDVPIVQLTFHIPAIRLYRIA